jgi:aconitase A
VKPSLAGPKRPQDRQPQYRKAMADVFKDRRPKKVESDRPVDYAGHSF